MTESVIGQLVRQHTISLDLSTIEERLDKFGEDIQQVRTEFPTKVAEIFDSRYQIEEVEKYLWEVSPGVYIGRELVEFFEQIGIKDPSDPRLKQGTEIYKLSQPCRERLEKFRGERSQEDWCKWIAQIAE